MPKNDSLIDPLVFRAAEMAEKLLTDNGIEMKENFVIGLSAVFLPLIKKGMTESEIMRVLAEFYH
jgi:hypothetical protein